MVSGTMLWLRIVSKSMDLLDILHAGYGYSHECRLNVITQRQWVAAACSAFLGIKEMAAENCRDCFAKLHAAV